jgi:hypothetical protein
MELRPNLADKNVRLIDVIDAENKARDLGEVDDRIVKFLERRHGQRTNAHTFGQRPVDDIRHNIFAMRKPVFPKQKYKNDYSKYSNVH